jgi:hypothetical protein
MEVAGEAPAQMCFQCDAQTFVLLAYGRLSPSSACAAGLLTATGSAPWAEIGSVAKLGFGGKIQKSDLRKSMACELQLSCFR